MNKFLFIFFGLFMMLQPVAFAQSEQKVKWQYDVLPKGNNLFEVRLTAKIDKGWHLYSRQQSSDAIALPTTVLFAKNPLLEMKGELKESGVLINQLDPATKTRSRYYAGQVIFIQKVYRKKKVNTTLNGTIEFMVCDDRQCLPPSTVKFQLRFP
jgi:thiol:disulfide interchange protein DsbD